MEPRKRYFLINPLRDFPKEAKFSTQWKIVSLLSSLLALLGCLARGKNIKILLQQLWKLGRKWDETLPLDLLDHLKQLLNSYHYIPQLEIPQQVSLQSLLEIVN